MSKIPNRSSPSLQDLRNQIDAIDNQIHDLIMARTHIVEEVCKIKKDNPIKIHPAREAEIIYRLFERHRGLFGKQELFSIWRSLIMGTLRIEGPFSVAVYMPDNEGKLLPLAREHYGSSVPLITLPKILPVIDAITTQKATVGVMPMPSSGERNTPWWIHLMKDTPDCPRIIGCLPFCRPASAPGYSPEALVICPVNQGKAGQDRAYIALECDESITKDQIQKTLATIDVDVGYINSWQCPPPLKEKYFLVETGRYLEPEDRVFRDISDHLSIPENRIFNLGGYAIPLSSQKTGNKDLET